jgi:hypothetical protein
VKGCAGSECAFLSDKWGCGVDFGSSINMPPDPKTTIFASSPLNKPPTCQRTDLNNHDDLGRRPLTLYGAQAPLTFDPGISSRGKGITEEIKCKQRKRRNQGWRNLKKSEILVKRVRKKGF